MTRRHPRFLRSVVLVSLTVLVATGLVGLAPAAPAKKPTSASKAALAKKAVLAKNASKARALAQASVLDRRAPSAPTGLRVTAASAGSVTVMWLRSADNVGVKGYGLYRGGARVDSVPGTKYTFRRLACGMSYALGVDAFDAAGNHSSKAQVVAATAPCTDLQAPAAPTGLQQTGATAGTVTISWSPPQGETIGGYGVYVGSLQVATTQSTVYTFSQLACGTTREVGVDAYDVAGNRSPITGYFVTTSPCPDTQAPSTPGSVSQTGATATSMSLSWGPSTDNVGVAGYDVSVGSTRARTSGPGVEATGLACGTSYQVTVSAVDTAGNRSAARSATAATVACAPRHASPAPPPAPAPAPSSSPDTAAPTMPTGLAVGASTGSTIALRWQPSSDNRSVAGYGLYRNGARVADATTTAYTFDGLRCGSSYELGVDAVDAAGNRSGVNRIVASSATCTDTTAPAAPVDLVVTDRTETSIAVRWAQASGVTDLVGYRLYRGGTLVGETAGNAFTFADLTCATSYSLGVAARDAAGNVSAQTVTLAVTLNCPDTTPPPAPAALTAGNVTQTGATLSWSAAAGAAAYGLSVNGSSIGTTTQTAYTFSGLACGTSTVLGVESIDGAGNRSSRVLLTVTTLACAPAPTPVPPPPPPPSGSAQVALSPAGNDATCGRGDLSRPCRMFQRAYDVAQSGDTIAVFGGAYPADDLSRDSLTIFGGEKQVTFACAGAGTVQAEAALLTIKADNVTLRGRCFKLRVLRIGEGGDPRGIKNVLVEDVKLDGLEVVGAEATIRRTEIGPNVACWPANSSQPASMRCDPNSPDEWERFWAYRDPPAGFQTFLHANGAGVNAKVVMEQVWIHDIQTKDAERLHTGCMLIWNNGQVVSDQIVIRNSRLERCAVLGILVDGGHGITLEGNYFGPPIEPLSNGLGDDVEAGDFAREFGVRTDPINGGAWVPTNYKIVGNTFSHGTNPDSGLKQFANFLFDGNYLGRANTCWPGATYGANSGVSACGSSPLAAPPFAPATPPWGG